MLGHEPLSTTQRYTQLSMEHVLHRLRTDASAGEMKTTEITAETEKEVGQAFWPSCEEVLVCCLGRRRLLTPLSA
jgi:hypothetical protein